MVLFYRGSKSTRQLGPMRFAKDIDRLPSKLIEYKLSDEELQKMKQERPTHTKEDYERLIAAGHSANSIREMWGWDHRQLELFKKRYGIRGKYSRTT